MLQDYFDRIYCLNLDRRPDRWAEALSELERHNIEGVLRFSATDGHNTPNPTSLRPGEFGILHSHINMIRQAKEDNLSSLFILEDDAVFHDEFNTLFPQFMQQVPQDWDFIYLGGNHLHDHPVQINTSVHQVFHAYTTHAIGIRSTLFDLILETLPRMKKQVDVYYADIQKAYKAYCSTPHLSWQRAGYSDIQDQTVDYRFLKGR